MIDGASNLAHVSIWSKEHPICEAMSAAEVVLLHVSVILKMSGLKFRLGTS